MNYAVPRVQALPVADDRVSFQIDGIERLGWHHAWRYPRPYFYPLIGPSGRSLTRMGHPTAPDHDHHRSIWFAHTHVAGVNFWPEGQEPQIRQERWVLYEDGAHEAAMVVELGWYDAHQVRLMRQQLVAVLRAVPGDRSVDDLGEVELEVQSIFTPELESLELGKTNFGFFAVRVARSISAHYGAGRLRSSEGSVGEKQIHERPARWVDYSGPIAPGEPPTWEGMTYFDHPDNPHQPTHWHVRDDGWMEASLNQRSAYTLRKDSPLVLRYLLAVHRGDVDPGRAERRHQSFAESAGYEVVARAAPYRHALQRRSTKT